jgi:hypothetical protein
MERRPALNSVTGSMLMEKRLYMVYDLIACTVIGTPILERADAAAMRAFNDALAHPESLLGQHPKDFNLLYVGSISEDGLILPVLGDSPQIIATGASWLNLKESANA